MAGSGLERDSNGHEVPAMRLAASVQPAGYEHSHWFESPVVSLCACFRPAFAESVGNYSEVLGSPAVVSSAGVARVAHRIAQEIKRSDSASHLILEGLFVQLVGEIWRSKSEPEVEKTPLWFNGICELLRARFRERVTVETLASELGLDPGRVVAYFRQQFGRSIGKYLRELRTDSAVDLLLHSKMPISEIAAESGFSDHSHLARVIRASYGVSPTQLRATSRETVPD